MIGPFGHFSQAWVQRELLSSPTSGQPVRRPAPVVLKQPNDRLSPEHVTGLIADYQVGTRLRAIAAKYRISGESTVKRRIRSSGTPHRKLGGSNQDRVQEPKRLYVDEGWWILKVSKRLG